MKKRIIAILVAVLCFLSLSGCLVGWTPFQYDVEAEDCETFHVYSIVLEHYGPFICNPSRCEVSIYDENFNEIDFFTDGYPCDVTIDCVSYMDNYQLDRIYIKLEPWMFCGMLWAGGRSRPIGSHWWRINDIE